MKKHLMKLLVLLPLLAVVFFGINQTHIQAQQKTVLKVEVFDRAAPGFKADDNYWTKWIQKEFGDPNNIQMQFVTVPRAEEVSKVNILMASGDAPDVTFMYDQDTVYNYVLNDTLTDLGPLIAKHGQNLKKFLGKFCMDTGVFLNKQYSVAARRVMVGCMTSFIRKDWLDTLKLPLPTTTQEWYNDLKAFKEKDPGNIGKDKVIPLSLNLYESNVTWAVRLMLDSFVPGTITDEQEQTLPVWLKPGYKEGMKLLNKMYGEGLISPEFALDKNGKISNTDCSIGKVGSIMGNFDIVYRATPGISTELAKNVKGGLFVPVDTFKDAKGLRRKRQYGANGFYIFVPKYSKRAVEAVKYLNWLSDKKVLDFLLYGVEGTNFKERIQGIPVNIPQDGEMKLSIDIPVIVNGNDFGDIDKNILAGSLNQLPEFQDLWRQAYKMSITAERPYWDMSFPIASQAKYKQALYEKDTEIFSKTIMCKPEEFNALYDRLVKEYLAAGGQEVMTDRTAYYKKNYGGAQNSGTKK
jgi:putative aldouronate transport system substrate-binding protein